MPRKKTEEPATDRKRQLAAIEAVADKFSKWKPAAEALELVRSVPTIFPMFDAATRVGGLPIERVTLVHGPSSEGKTMFVLGLGLSFLKRGHFFGMVDAEFTTPIDWCRSLMGEEADNPGFRAIRPSSYEETVSAVREFVGGIADARKAKLIPEDTTALLAVDSLDKLVPENLLEKMQAEAVKDGVDGLKGMAGMISANMHKAWLKELTPLLYFTRTALVFIARESSNVGAGKWEQKWKVVGGASPFYDSSLACRVTRGFVKDGDKIECERHGVRIYKTKVGAKSDRYVDAAFHSFSDPPRFDLARDALEMGIASGSLEKSGGKITTADDGEVLGMSAAKAAQALRDNPEQLERALAAAVKGYQAPEEALEAA